MNAYQPVAQSEMLKDGSNPECVNPVPPLNWTRVEDLKDVTLYGLYCSPPSAKLMAYFHFYNVPFTVVPGLNKPGSDYKKMPVLDVNGRQVNDTFIILKNLIPVLTGGFNEEWEAICSYQLPISIEETLSRADQVAWMSSPAGFEMPNWLIKCCLGAVLYDYVIKPHSVDAQRDFPDKYKVVPLNDLGAKFKKEIGTQNFHGGSEPGQVDISFYGTLAPFYFSGCENVKAMVNECDLQPWWSRMQTVIPFEKLFPVEA